MCHTVGLHELANFWLVAMQVEQKEAALASLQDQVKRAVEGGGEKRDRVAQMQVRDPEPIPSKASQRFAPARTDGWCVERSL